IDSSDLTQKNTISYKSLGKEACGKLTCFKYQVFDKTQTASSQFVWFDTKDYRMQRYQMSDGKDTTDMTITYQTVKITQPSPVQDFSGITIPTNVSQPDEE